MKNLENVMFYDTKKKVLFNAGDKYDGLNLVIGNVPNVEFVPVIVKTADNRQVNLGLDSSVGIFEGKIEKDKTRESNVFIRDRHLGEIYFTLKVFKHWNNIVRYQFVELENGDIILEEVID